MNTHASHSKNSPAKAAANRFAGQSKQGRNIASATAKSTVAQLARRTVNNVRFNGFSNALRDALLGRVPRRTNVIVTPTDNVGGNFKVVFDNNNGPAISLATAQGWVDQALAALEESGSESDSD